MVTVLSVYLVEDSRGRVSKKDRRFSARFKVVVSITTPIVPPLQLALCETLPVIQQKHAVLCIQGTAGCHRTRNESPRAKDNVYKNTEMLQNLKCLLFFILRDAVQMYG